MLKIFLFLILILSNSLLVDATEIIYSKDAFYPVKLSKKHTTRIILPDKIIENGVISYNKNISVNYAKNYREVHINILDPENAKISDLVCITYGRTYSFTLIPSDIPSNVITVNDSNVNKTIIPKVSIRKSSHPYVDNLVNLLISFSSGSPRDIPKSFNEIDLPSGRISFDLTDNESNPIGIKARIIKGYSNHSLFVYALFITNVVKENREVNEYYFNISGSRAVHIDMPLVAENFILKPGQSARVFIVTDKEIF